MQGGGFATCVLVALCAVLCFYSFFGRRGPAVSTLMFDVLSVSRRCRVNDLESVNKAQKIRLEQLAKQAPDVEVATSKLGAGVQTR